MPVIWRGNILKSKRELVMNPWLLGMHQNFGSQKWHVRKRKTAENMMCTAGFTLPLAVVTAWCDALLNIPLYECAFHWVAHGPCERATHVPLMLTGKAKSTRITRQQKIYFSVKNCVQFTIVLPCCKSVVQLYWATLVKWRSPLLTCSDNSFVGLYIIWIIKNKKNQLNLILLHITE